MSCKAEASAQAGLGEPGMRAGLWAGGKSAVPKLTHEMADLADIGAVEHTAGEGFGVGELDLADGVADGSGTNRTHAEGPGAEPDKQAGDGGFTGDFAADGDRPPVLSPGPDNGMDGLEHSRVQDGIIVE